MMDSIKMRMDVKTINIVIRSLIKINKTDQSLYILNNYDF